MSNLVVSSLIGLLILVVLTLENLILCRRKTFIVMLLDHLFFTIVLYFIFNWLILVYSGVLLAFIIFIKIRNHQTEGADFDYNNKLLTLSALINKFIKPKDIIIGKILPTNHTELKYNRRYIGLNNTVLSGGTLITGSTGSGKTTTMKSILKQRINEKKPVVFFDYKGEEEILDEIKEYADEVGTPYYEFSNRECTFTYDPFVNLDETGKVEALMNTRRWSADGADEHYKTSMQLAIQNLVRAYDEVRNPNKNYIVGLYNFSETYHPQQSERDGFINLRKSLEILLTSKAEQLFKDNPAFSFEKDEPYVICFSFTSANKQLANNISSFVYTDIMDRGTRRPYRDKLLLCIDEFGTLEASTIIKDLLEKGRSGGIQTVFSILDINQIAMTSGEYFVQAILGTINNYIIHAGATQKTAELLAGVQKFDKSFDIMSLQKPYEGKKPTALFITKYGIINSKHNQTMFKIEPYINIHSKPGIPTINKVDNIKEENKNNTITTTTEEPNQERYIIPVEELDLSQPIDNIDDYL